MPTIDYVEINTDLDVKRTWYTDGSFEDNYNDPAAGFSVKRITIWEPITITDQIPSLSLGSAGGTVVVEGDEITEFEYSIDDWATSDTFTATGTYSGTWAATGLSAGVYTLKVRHATLTRMRTSTDFKVLSIATYGTKWQIQFDKIKVPSTQSSEEYTINISKKGYSGAVTEVVAGGDPAVLEHSPSDESDPFDAIIPTRLNLVIASQTNNIWLDILSADWDEYRVTLVRGVTTVWQGYFDLSSYQEDFRDPPFHVSITAMDGFAFMKDRDIESRTGNRWNAHLSMSEFIWHICREFRLPQQQYIWMHQYPDGSSGCPLEDIYIDCNALYKSGVEDRMITFWEAIYSRLRPLRLRAFVDNQKIYIQQCEKQPASGGYPTEYRGTPGSFSAVSNDFIATIGIDPLVDSFFFLGGGPVLSWERGYRDLLINYRHNWTANILPRDTFLIPAATEVWIDDPMDEPYLHEDEFWGQNLDTATAYYETIDDAVTDSIAVVGVKVAKNVVASDESSFYAYTQEEYALLCATHTSGVRKYFKNIPVKLDYDGTSAPRVRYTMKGNVVSDPQLYVVTFAVSVFVAGHWLNVQSAAATLMTIDNTGATQDDHDSTDQAMYRQPNTATVSEGDAVYNRKFSLAFEGVMPWVDQINPSMQIRLHMLFFNAAGQAVANAGVVWEEISAQIVDQEYEEVITFEESVDGQFDGKYEFEIECMTHSMAGGVYHNRAQYFSQGNQAIDAWAQVGAVGTKTHEELLRAKLGNEINAVRSSYSGRFGENLRFYHRPYINATQFMPMYMAHNLKYNHRTVRMIQMRDNVW